MPIYEYECLTCGTMFEKRQSFSDDALADCPNGHDATRRLLSAPAIVFKGSGFYITDNKKSTKSNGTGTGANGSANSDSSSESKADNGSNDKTEAKSETKSESKNETKSETKTESKVNPSTKSD